MSSFINKIISRHLFPNDNVRPRLRSRFEGTEQTPVKTAVTDEIGITETIPRKSVQHPNTDLKGNSDKWNTNESSLDNQSDFTIKSNTELRTEINEDSNLKVTHEKLFLDESNKTTASKIEPLISEPIPTLSTQESSKNLGNMSLEQPPYISFDSKTELTSKNQNQKKLSGEEQNTGKKFDFSINEKTNSNDSVDEPEIKNVLLQLSEVQNESKIPQKSNELISNSLIGSSPSGNIPDLKPSFKPIFNTSQGPVIKVSIGRINIRAEVQKPTSRVKSKANISKPKMSLDEYLKKQNNQAK